MPDDYGSSFVSAQDGLRLHVYRYGRHSAAHLPVVCLPGLARTGADFEELARFLSNSPEQPRHVVALDSRGRGRSEHDRNPANYSFTVELNDLLAVLTALGIGPAVFVGTSRGGILTMLLAAIRPTAIAGAVLNDIGPAIEPAGLMRIKGYVGKLPQPKSFDEAADILRRLFAGHFPKLSPAEWLAFARRSFTEADGRLVPSYDPQLGKTLEGINVEQPLPPLWREFDALSRVPLMVIRGANSDVLSPATLKTMRERRRHMEILEVPDQGHAPLLTDSTTIQRIGAFIAHCEAAGTRQELA
jgi:pimeloyl-ACP methyl ester carboxylesterase